MSDFLVNQFIHAFVNNINQLLEVYTAIKEFLNTNLCGTADSAGTNFEYLFITTKLEDFVYASKTNASDELFCTSTRSAC